MKELESPNKLKPDTEFSVQQRQQKEYKLIGSQKYHNGHKCWEINLHTGEIREAEYHKSDITWDVAENGMNTGKKSRRVIVKENCIYRTALNKKNVLLKLKKEQITVTYGQE